MFPVNAVKAQEIVNFLNKENLQSPPKVTFVISSSCHITLFPHGRCHFLQLILYIFKNFIAFMFMPRNFLEIFKTSIHIMRYILLIILKTMSFFMLFPS